MKTILKGVALSAIASSVVMAGGYKIPEQSLNSMALGAAYVAHTTGADTAYYNPANMAFMDEKHYVEGAITLAHLPSIDYYGMAESEIENILIPNFHYVSAPIGNFRWGVSLTAPGGLTKRWNEQPGKAFAEEFTLKIIELNPSMSYRVTDKLSVGAGLRFIYSEGVVKSDARGIGSPFKVDMEGDTFEFGYNLAVTYTPVEDIVLAATYRSNIDLDEEGTATITYPITPTGVTITGDAGVSVPLPAALNLAISKTWDNTFTLEFVYERTFWSTYKVLEFTGTNIPISNKDWVDTNTFKLGATVELDKVTIMMGLAIDETPVPNETLSFELPDSDAKIFSMGFRYQQTESLSWGAAFLYDSKDPRSIEKGISENPVINANGASFSGGGAYLTTVGIAYEF
jgi:long-chain fatty acid transport protein